MLAKLELTLDCADAAALAEFWKLAVGYVEAPPPAPFATQAEWRESLANEDDDGMHAA